MLANLIRMGGGQKRPINEISYENHKKVTKTSQKYKQTVVITKRVFRVAKIKKRAHFWRF